MNSPSCIAPETEPTPEFQIPVGLELRGKIGPRVPASVRRVNAGFLQLSSPVYLLKDTRLYVFFDQQRVEVEVVYCRPEDTDRYLVGVRMNPESSGSVRREPRLPLDLPAKLIAPNLVDPVQSRVVDMSSNGMGLTVPFEIPVGTDVSVELSYGIAFGEIRHCTQKSPGSWRVGLWLEEFVSRGGEVPPPQRAEQNDTSGESGLLNRLKTLFRR